MKIIIANGPPNCGKDEFVKHLGEQFGCPAFSFKTKLIEATCAFYDISDNEWKKWYTREGKEEKRAALRGLSQREALIRTSERVLKPVFGKTFFGEQEAKHLKQIDTDIHPVVVCSDGGFNEEIEPLADVFGAENIFIVQIHRPGCSYQGDSRNWIDSEAIPDSNYIKIQNNQSLEYFHDEIESTYYYIMEN